jgi:hypothetical protein
MVDTYMLYKIGPETLIHRFGVVLLHKMSSWRFIWCFGIHGRARLPVHAWVR